MNRVATFVLLAACAAFAQTAKTPTLSDSQKTELYAAQHKVDSLEVQLAQAESRAAQIQSQIMQLQTEFSKLQVQYAGLKQQSSDAEQGLKNAKEHAFKVSQADDKQFSLDTEKMEFQPLPAKK